MRPNLIVKYNYSHVHGSSLFMNCCKKKCGTRVCDENGCLSVLENYTCKCFISYFLSIYRHGLCQFHISIDIVRQLKNKRSRNNFEKNP